MAAQEAALVMGLATGLAAAPAADQPTGAGATRRTPGPG